MFISEAIIYLLLVTSSVLLQVVDGEGGEGGETPTAVEAGNQSVFFFPVGIGGISPGLVASVIGSRLQNLLGKDMQVRPYEETPRADRTVACDRDLDCNFQSSNGTCRWHNVKNDAGPSYIKDVYRGLGSPNKTGRALMKNIIFGTDEVPQPGYGVIASQQMNASKIHFCSDPIPFEKPKAGDEGIVTLKHWIMPKSTISACVRVYDPLNRATIKDMAKRKWPINWLGCSKEVKFEDKNPGPSDLAINLYNSYKSLESLAKKHKKSTAELRSVKYEVCLLLGPFPVKQGGLMFIDDLQYRSGLCGDKGSRSKAKDRAKRPRQNRNKEKGKRAEGRRAKE